MARYQNEPDSLTVDEAPRRSVRQWFEGLTIAQTVLLTLAALGVVSLVMQMVGPRRRLPAVAPDFVPSIDPFDEDSTPDDIDGQTAQSAANGPKGGATAKGAEIHLAPVGLSAVKTPSDKGEETPPADDGEPAADQPAPPVPPTGEGERRAFQDGQ